MLRSICGSRRDEVTGEWRRLRNEELYTMYPSLNVIQVIKSRRMRGAGHVARMGERRNAYMFWCGNLREGEHVKDPSVDGRIILKWTFEKWYGEHGLDRSGSG